MILTHVGGPTLLVEVDGWRLLTDPTFDPAGGHYDFGWGTSSDKVTGPAVELADVGPVDAVLLTHDHHGDNLDTAGRAMLSSVPTVLTTSAGAKRLAAVGPDVRGLSAGDVSRLVAEGKPDLEVTATPARHGPPLTRPIVGQVVGFAIRRAGESQVLVWVTGDTVLYGALRDAARTMTVDVLVVHVGGVQFPITGPLRYTMTGRDAVQVIDLVRPRVAVPVHYEGWAHFKDGRAGLASGLAGASDDTQARVQQLDPGKPTDLG